MYLYIDEVNNRLHGIFKVSAADNPEMVGCREVVVPDSFDEYVYYTNEQGQSRRREKTAQEVLDSITYADKRAVEYPPIADYIDGVVKGDQAQIDAYIAACQAIKNQYPKPTQE